MIESSTPYALTQLQVQLADAYAPREALAQMDPLSGSLSRAWSEYITFISKNMGYRGSVMSYAQFCGFHNSNYASGHRVNIDIPEAPKSTHFDSSCQLAPVMCPPKVDD